MIATYGTHKDAVPVNTIAKIKTILHNLGIEPVVHYWDSFGEANYSMVLTDPGLCITNGKGISREYALASAYGEFMERLQNLYLFPTSYGLMKEPLTGFPDAVLKDISFAAPFLGKFLRMLGVDPNSPKEVGLPTQFLPFWDVFNKKATYIPTLALDSSNGMCAGNTPEEALIEGICEILERYVLSQLFFKSAVLPDIPMEDIKNLGVYRLIDDISKNGYHVIVKDMTLGGKFPVVGTLLLNKDRTKYRVRLGSSPIFETAVQRCLTEIAQSSSFSDFEYKMADLQFDYCEKLVAERNSKDKKLLIYHFSQNKITGVGHFPADLFTEGTPDGSYKKAFEEKFNNSKQSLHFLLDIIKGCKQDLYIRDVNFLDFPAYQLYISQLSCVGQAWFLENPDEFLSIIVRNRTRGNILRLNSLDDTSLNQLAATMKEDIASPIFGIPNMYSATYFVSSIAFGASQAFPFRFDQIPYTIMLVLILYRLKEYREALNYLTTVLDKKKTEYEQLSGFDLAALRACTKSKLQRHLPLEDPAVYLYQPMYYFIKKLSLGIPENEAKEKTAKYFGEKRTAELLDFLSMKTLGVPNCGDCSRCSLRDECLYEKWSRRIKAIDASIKNYFPAQANLEKLFNDYGG